MNTGSHLTLEAIHAWRSKTLQPAQIAEVGEHLANCEECRAALVAPETFEQLTATLAGAVQHAGYDDLEALVHNRPGEEDRERWSAHFAVCPACAAEFDDLRRFAASRAAPKRRGWWIAVPVLLAAAAGVVLAVRATAPKPAARIVAAIPDSGRTIALDADGKLHGLQGASPELAGAVADAIRSETMPATAAGSVPEARRDVLLGSGSPESAINGFSPSAVVTPDRSPTFYWNAPAGASGFVVTIYTTDFMPVETSPRMSAKQWQPLNALQPGKTYIWTVSADLNGGRVTAPGSPEPEARFRVATDDERRQIDAAGASRSNLAVAVTAARLGMFREAGRALQQLDSNDALTQHLRQSFQSQHAAAK